MLHILWGTLAVVWILGLYHLQSVMYASSNGVKKITHFEFGGPFGTLILLFVLPLTDYALYFLCKDTECMSVNPFSSEFLQISSLPWDFGIVTMITNLWSMKAVFAVVCWFMIHVFLHLVVPGPIAEGLPILNTKTHLSYCLNGFRCAIISFIVVGGLVYHGYLSPSFGFDNYVELMTASILLSTGIALYSYISSFTDKNCILAEGGNSGYMPYDFFIGRALNPRLGSFDFKFFCELRPGLLGWVLLDLSMAMCQYERLGYISNSMILICFFHTYYVLDSLYFERAILSTMDITTDGFGFMLSFGDLVWVPFTYSLQARYLVSNPVNLSPFLFCFILSLNLLGFWIFRSSNSQKNAFRTNPKDPALQHLKTMDTKRGTKLLISGWWGISRHINYFGDWLMGISYCLPCGFNHAIPYFYALYFTILLTHRQLRDEHNCREKYGADWDRYCAKVKSAIIPYVY